MSATDQPQDHERRAGRIVVWGDDLSQHRWTEWSGNHVDKVANNGEGLTGKAHAIDQAIEHAAGRASVVLGLHADDRGGPEIFPALPGAAAITRERQRHIRTEGYDAAHDDEHGPQIILQAGLAYATHASAQLHGWGTAPEHRLAPTHWPFDADTWKPDDDPLRNLEKAGALIAAAYDTALRARTTPGDGF